MKTAKQQESITIDAWDDIYETMDQHLDGEQWQSIQSSISQMKEYFNAIQREGQV